MLERYQKKQRGGKERHCGDVGEATMSNSQPKSSRGCPPAVFFLRYTISEDRRALKRAQVKPEHFANGVSSHILDIIMRKPTRKGEGKVKGELNDQTRLVQHV